MLAAPGSSSSHNSSNSFSALLSLMADDPDDDSIPKRPEVPPTPRRDPPPPPPTAPLLLPRRLELLLDVEVLLPIFVSGVFTIIHTLYYFMDYYYWVTIVKLIRKNLDPQN
jgi:hypothetical protein